MINLKGKEKRREKNLPSQNACLNLSIAEPDPTSSRFFFFNLLSTPSNPNLNLLEERKSNGLDDGQFSAAERCPIYRKSATSLATRWGKMKRLAVMPPLRTVASTTARPWYWLACHSSVLPLFPRAWQLRGIHGDSKDAHLWVKTRAKRFKNLQNTENSHTWA